MDFTSDIPGMLVDFGVTLSSPGGDMLGLLIEPYAEAFGMVAGSQPACLVPSSSLVVTLPAVGDILTVGGRSFAITGFEPDGTGITRITLEAH